MATRKSRLTTDSPTPNVGNEMLTPSTPTRKKSGRKPNMDASSKIDKNDEEVSQLMEKDTILSPTRGRPRTKVGLVKNEQTSPRKGKRANRSVSRVTGGKEKLDSPTLTTKSKPGIKTRRNSTGKIDVGTKRSSRSDSEKLRSGRLRKVVNQKPNPAKIKVVRKRLKMNNEKTEGNKAPKKAVKVKVEPSSDSELLPIAGVRRRSDSVSKCSDLTDASSFMDVPLVMLKDDVCTESQDNNKKVVKKENEDGIDEIKLMEIKREIQNDIQAVLVGIFDRNKTDGGTEKIKAAEMEIRNKILENISLSLNDSGIGDSDGSQQATKEEKQKPPPPQPPQQQQQQKKGAQKRIPKPVAVVQKLKKSARVNAARKKTANIVKAKTKTQAKVGLKKTVQKRKELIKNVAKDSIVTPVHIETIVKSPKPPPTSTVTSQPLEVPIPTAAQASPLIQETPEMATASPSSAQANIPTDPETSNVSKSPLLATTADLPEVNVNQFYGHSEFLENNLGIEKDPKLVEIVQVHEKNILEVENTKNDKETTDEMIAPEKTVAESSTKKEIDAKSEENKEKDLDCSELSPDIALALDDSCGDENAIEGGDEKTQGESIPSISIEMIGKIIIENGVHEVTNQKEIKVDAQTVEINKIESNDTDDKKQEKILEDVIVPKTEENVIKKEEEMETECKKNEVTENEPMEVDENVKQTKIEVEVSDPDKAIIENEPQKQQETDKNEMEIINKNENTTNDDETKVLTKVDTPVDLKEAIISGNIVDIPGEITKDLKLTEPDNKENILNNSKEQLDESQQPSNLIPSSDTVQEKKENHLIEHETPELVKQKESHLLKLGLLPHKVAAAAKIEKQKRREILQKNAATKTQKNVTSATEYTGTLKTVIKLRRNSVATSGSKEMKKPRESLKMTLHKGRGKGNGITDKETGNFGTTVNDYYTIQSETDVTAETINGAHGRKTHYRSHTSETNITESENKNVAVTAIIATATAADPIKALVIPEKASSFRIHPGKLCQDQCFYCGGKFGLFDTPCHVAQIKSLERQKNILDNEEKLTVDNCLCDACFRHVDRRANCPSYKKRLSAPPAISTSNHSEMVVDTNSDDMDDTPTRSAESPSSSANLTTGSHKSAVCQVNECGETATHSVRRKWYLKMKKSISKLLNLNADSHLAVLSICDKHYDVISHLMVCALCKRRLVRNHVYYITQDTAKLQQLLTMQGVPVIIGSSLIVCKLCRYYSNILLKPPDMKNQKMMFAKNYRRRLLQFHNIETAAESDTDQSSSPPNDVDISNPKRGRPAKRTRRLSPGIQSPQQVSVTYVDDNNYPQISSNQIVTENEVIVDCTQPSEVSIEPKPKKIFTTNSTVLHTPPKIPTIQTKFNDSNQDISLLRANPNISMRELFPGEEEMGLQVTIPFSSGGLRTPEGWTKIMTVIQYDEPTRRLWEELQKPYGNQSSFLRHLILLEKYFRNGELMLADGAGESSTVYAESAQQRLLSFDGRREMNNGSVSLLKINNGSKPPSSHSKDKKRASSNQTASLLKPELSTTAKPRGRPPNCFKEFKGGMTMTKSDPPPTILENRIIKAAEAMIKSGAKSTKVPTPLPPELICISTGAKTGGPNLPPQQQIQQQKQSNQQSQPKQSQMLDTDQIINQKPKQLSATAAKSAQNVIRLPDVLSMAEKLETKWRPTLMPVTAGLPALDGQLYQTVDGRKLPNLVQVQSGGKPYLISIYDYNRMCIVRRERLLQLQIQQNNQPPLTTSGNVGGNAIPSTSNMTASKQMTNHSTMQQQIQQQLQQAQQQAQQQMQQQQMQHQVQQFQQQFQHQFQHHAQAQHHLQHMQQQQQNQMLNPMAKVPTASMPPDPKTKYAYTASKVQIPNKILEQNSVIPLASSSANNIIPSMSISMAIPPPPPPPSSSSTKSSVLDSLLKVRKPNASTSLLKPNIHSTKATTHTITSGDTKIISITSTPSITEILGVSSAVDQPIPSTSAAAAASSASGKSSQSALDALYKATQQTSPSNNMWIYAETLGGNNNNSISGCNSNAALGGNSNTLTGTSLLGGQNGPIIDSSAASLLAKIPKSLTVIPQQKNLPSSSKSSGDDSPSNSNL